jgi:hypothetical protein
MKPTIEQIKQAKDVLRADGYIINFFHRDDLTYSAERLGVELSDAEMDLAVERLENIDADWDMIEYTVMDIIDERNS